jgi:SAM-dependent methyltransferase
MKDEAELYCAFDSDPAPVVDFLRWLASVHELPSPPHVLDIGCGPGRLLLPLSRLGWHVVGMEPNEAFFTYAKTVAVPMPLRGLFMPCIREDFSSWICRICSGS